jgi:hypothetical protein
LLWRNYLDSTEAFTAKQGDSLAYFCSNIDKFSAGPILENGKGNGKNINSALVATTHALLPITKHRSELNDAGKAEYERYGVSL